MGVRGRGEDRHGGLIRMTRLTSTRTALKPTPDAAYALHARLTKAPELLWKRRRNDEAKP